MRSSISAIDGDNNQTLTGRRFFVRLHAASQGGGGTEDLTSIAVRVTSDLIRWLRAAVTHRARDEVPGQSARSRGCVHQEARSSGPFESG